MTDLHDRFRTLDRVPAPDLWSEVTQRSAAARTETGGWTWRTDRAGFIVRAVAVTAVVSAALVGLLIYRGPNIGAGPSIGPLERILISNQRHEAVTIDITGRQSVTLDDCSEVVVELPLHGDWSISEDGRVAYSAAQLRASGIGDRDNQHPVVVFQGGVQPFYVDRKAGIPEAQVIEACREGT
jgi:hypothetical protein